MIVTLSIIIKQPTPGQSGYTIATAQMTIDANPDTVDKILKALKMIDGLDIR